jgi:hypothetical protein
MDTATTRPVKTAKLNNIWEVLLLWIPIRLDLLRGFNPWFF